MSMMARVRGWTERMAAAHLEEFRRIATRYDKSDTSFSAMIHLAGSYLALK